MSLPAYVRSVLLAATLFCLVPAAVAQRGAPGGGGRPGGMQGGGMPGGFSGGPGGFGDRGSFPHGGPPPGGPAESAGTTGAMRGGGLQIGPPGRWWDDKHFAKDLKLRNDQQRRMDGIFESNRSTLLRSYQNLEQEQGRLEMLTRSRSLDENSLFTQIDRVAQARAELQKANAHYLLQIRNEMDPDQVQRLEQHR